MGIEQSLETLERTIKELEPYAIVSMISGGKDSLAAYLVAKQLGVKITHILHGITGTGVKETTDFVRQFAAGEDPTYLEANAGTAYEEYVQRKGFFGRGHKAHSYSYHILKHQRFKSTVAKHIRHHKWRRNILLLNGARVGESAGRGRKLPDAVRKYQSNYWVNVCHDWSKEERDNFLSDVEAPVNPVTVKLCRSGECLCGTAQNNATREEVSYYYPKWGQWLDDLERPVKAKFGWGWGENMPAKTVVPDPGRPVQLSLFQPMCVDCRDGLEDA